MSNELRISRRTLIIGIVAGLGLLAIAAAAMYLMRPAPTQPASLPPAPTDAPATDASLPTDAPTEQIVASSDELSYAESLPSDESVFVVSYSPVSAPIAINAMHEWTLHVASADGQPVEGASILVSGGMPEHGHGLPTVPQVTEDLGGGDYRVEGMKFQMPGWWIVTFIISADGQTDSVTFNLRLN